MALMAFCYNIKRLAMAARPAHSLSSDAAISSAKLVRLPSKRDSSRAREASTISMEFSAYPPYKGLLNTTDR